MELSKFKFFNFNSIGSTNDKCKELVGSGNCVVVAKEQVTGRGRFDRVWESGLGGAWFSIGLKGVSGRIQLLSFVASLSVLKVLKRYNDEFDLKWPNDVLYEGKKISGILLESVIQDKIDVVIGIGVNIDNDVDVDGSISLKTIVSEQNDVEKFIKDVVDEFSSYFELFVNEKYSEIIKEWKESCGMIGKELEINTIGRNVKGKFVDISEEGFMILENDDGQVEIKEGDLIY